MKVKIIGAKIFPGSKEKTAQEDAAAWLESLCVDGFSPLSVEVKGGAGRVVVSGQSGGSLVLVKR